MTQTYLWNKKIMDIENRLVSKGEEVEGRMEW